MGPQPSPPTSPVTGRRISACRKLFFFFFFFSWAALMPPVEQQNRRVGPGLGRFHMQDHGSPASMLLRAPDVNIPASRMPPTYLLPGMNPPWPGTPRTESGARLAAQASAPPKY